MLTTTLLQEKIAKSLQSHEQNLAGSQYGKYFVRNMNLLLLKRDPDAWRVQQSSNRGASIPSTSSQTKSVSISASEKPLEQSPEVMPKLSSKRKRKGGDDIDNLFDSALGKKQKRSALPPAREEHTVSTDYDATGLDSILGAIKNAPKGDNGDRKHKKNKFR